MKSKWLIGVVVVSLALNITALGFLIGFASGPAPWVRGVDPTVGLARLTRFLPEERREQLAQAGTPAMSGGELRRSIGATLRELRGSQRIIGAVIAADPFDADELAAALAVFREHFAANQADSHKAFVEILKRMTPEERRQFLNTMRSGRHGRNHRNPPSGRGGAPRPGPVPQ